MGRRLQLGRVPRQGPEGALQHQRVPEDRRSRCGRSARRRPGQVRRRDRQPAGEGRGSVRPRGLSRRAARPAHLVRRHCRAGRSRSADALARLGLCDHQEPDPGMTAMPKVLIADELSPAAVQVFRNRGVEVDEKVGLKPKELRDIIGGYDGLAIRSATKVTPEVIAVAKNLKVVGRAGIGIDNIDLKAATAAGICVMNTPFGNSITTAEHAIAMMMALARHIPQADRTTQAGKWEKSKFVGVELYAKVLGLVGCGNIGSIVADRAQGLKMKVIAYDPFLSPERAVDLGVEKVELDELFHRADFISLHTPLTDQTRGLINRDSLRHCKQGVRIINCARGGLVVEDDLRAALDSGHVAGAAVDVFSEEPAKTNALFDHPHVVTTPHLGASSNEAQLNVALQVAEQMSDFLLHGAVTNALNMPSVTVEEAPRLRPYLKLAEQLGSFAGQDRKSVV